MRVIPPVTVDDAAFVSSNVPETDYSAWSAGTTYPAGARVIVVANHSIYQSVAAGNLGNDPVTDDGTKWVYVSKTNRWRAFDGRNSAKARNPGSITYDLNVSRTSDTVAFMGLEGITARVAVLDSGGTVLYDRIIDLQDTSTIVDWFSYYTWEADDYKSSVVFYGVPAYPGTKLRLTINAGGGTAGVSIIAYGRRRIIGETLFGTTPGLVDYSTRETDVFGETNVIQRAFAKTVTFNIAFPTSGIVAIQNVLEPLRATPAIYYENEDLNHGLIVLGFYSDFSPALMPNYTLSSVEITGVI